MKGVYTAVITPFGEDLSVDYATLERIIEQQAAAGVDGLIVLGTTGETPTLTAEEKKSIVVFAKKAVSGTKLKLIVGTGSNATAETIASSRWASSLGVDGLLVVTPYYNKPSQAGLIEHFRAVADASAGEIILYNVPGRTGVSFTADTVAELAAHPRIRSIKEATGNVEFASQIRESLARVGREMDILSGDDATYFPLLSVGACGVISVASHVCPSGMRKIQDACMANDFSSARLVHERFYPIFRDLFVESNPVPVKWAMSRLGFGTSRVRPPLAALQAASVEKLERLASRYQLGAGEWI